MQATSDPNQALLVAIHSLDQSAARQALENGADPDYDPRSGDNYGQTPLMLAAQSGSLPLCRQLLAAGASVNAGQRNWSNLQGTTALMAAAEQGHLSIVKYLLRQGADPHCRDSKGKRAIDLVEPCPEESRENAWEAWCRSQNGTIINLLSKAME